MYTHVRHFWTLHHGRARSAPYMLPVRKTKGVPKVEAAGGGGIALHNYVEIGIPRIFRETTPARSSVYRCVHYRTPPPFATSFHRLRGPARACERLRGPARACERLRAPRGLSSLLAPTRNVDAPERRGQERSSGMLLHLRSTVVLSLVVCNGSGLIESIDVRQTIGSGLRTFAG